MRTLTIVFVLAVAAVAQASPLGIGQTLFPAPAEPDPVAGLVIGDTGALPFVSPNFTGTLRTKVYNGDASNPFGLAALTFTYEVANDAASINSIARLTVNGYTGWLTDGSYQTPPIGVIPALVDRQSADVVGFSFIGQPLGNGLIGAGQWSSVLVVQTNATTFTTSIASVQDGTIAQVGTYAPSPEPASFVLAAVGMIGLVRRRKM